jgi:LacI family transcriptional regulator
MPVTMRDVAQKVGVSKQTVSAVLNGKPGISAATIARVQQAIAELGYQPNLVASSLRNGHTNTIGLLLPNITNPYFAGQARGAEDVAYARGYGVMLCDTYEDTERYLMYIQMLAQQQISGVIGISASKARELGLPASWIFQEIESVDDKRGGYVATAHLLDLGHRRIGCITAPANSQPCVDRLHGYRSALKDWGVEVNDNLIFEGAFDYAGGLRAVERLLHLNPELPTAIFVHQDLAAIGAMAGLKRAGLRVPEDVAIIGYDGLEIASFYDPPLSTIIQPIYELGAHAMTQLLDKLEGIEVSEPANLDCTLVVRASTVPTIEHEWFSKPIATGTPWKDWAVEERQTA